MLAPRNVQQGRVTVQPDKIEVTFTDGAETLPRPTSDDSKPLIEGPTNAS